jgi:methyl-accepting chemotaxis protein
MTSSLSKATENLRAIMGECTRPSINTETIRKEAEARARVGMQVQQELSAQAQQRTYDSLAKCSSAMMRMDVLVKQLAKRGASKQDSLSTAKQYMCEIAKYLSNAARAASDLSDAHIAVGETIGSLERLCDQLEELLK